MNKEESDKTFIIIFITVLVLTFILYISGVFDGNHSSFEQVKSDVYRECMDIGGTNCEEILLKQ